MLVVLSRFLSEKEKPSEFQSMAFKKGQNSASVLHVTIYHGMVQNKESIKKNTLKKKAISLHSLEAI